MKKIFVLVVLFVFPLVAYLFFASGVNNFGKLPVLTEHVGDLEQLNPEVSFRGKITILGFLGRDISLKKGQAFNLNQKIYKPFHEFRDFQVVMVVAEGSEEQAAELRKELEPLSDTAQWLFVSANKDRIEHLFHSLGTDLTLDENLSTPYMFIIDKDQKLRGRNDDEDEGVKYGFDASSVAELNNKMEDDVKIILAEYRLALKRNNAERSR